MDLRLTFADRIRGGCTLKPSMVLARELSRAGPRGTAMLSLRDGAVDGRGLRRGILDGIGSEKRCDGLTRGLASK